MAMVSAWGENTRLWGSPCVINHSTALADPAFHVGEPRLVESIRDIHASRVVVLLPPTRSPPRRMVMRIRVDIPRLGPMRRMARPRRTVDRPVGRYRQSDEPAHEGGRTEEPADAEGDIVP